MTEKLTASQLKHELAHYTGTEQWTRHWARHSMLMTDGVMFFAQHAGGGAFWLMDIIATEVWEVYKNNPFVFITLKVADSKAQLVVDDGNDNVLWEKAIDYTDCPEGDWQFYLTDNVVLLPSEY